MCIRDRVKTVLRRIKQQNRERMDVRRPTLVKALKDVCDEEFFILINFNLTLPSDRMLIQLILYI